LNERELGERLRDSLLSFDASAIKKLVQEAIEGGVEAAEIIESLRGGMEVIGEKYRSGELFVTDLIIAGEVMKEAQEALRPLMKDSQAGFVGTVLVATVAGDIHDIGKGIFAMLMNGEGFRVIDLGVDVSTERIVSAVKEHKPDILGLSALLTTNLMEIPKIVDALRKEGLRDKVKVIVGGATITERFAVESGADAYTKNAIDGMNLSKKWIKGPHDL
jgi:5-methyltetrahydrofolate--homocysteine methyltransferase